MGTFTVTKKLPHSFLFFFFSKEKRETAYLKGCSTLNYQTFLFSYEVFYQGISNRGKRQCIYTFCVELKVQDFLDCRITVWWYTPAFLCHCFCVGFCGCSIDCYTANSFLNSSSIWTLKNFGVVRLEINKTCKLNKQVKL